MKRIVIIILLGIVFISCKKENKAPVEKVIQSSSDIAPISDEILETAVIYEANIRQYSTEGTFDAFTKDIPQLKQLGVKIIWLMPINPISETKRKATGGDFASLIEDEAKRAKMLGSYYAVSDYTKVNPEFGTIDDFRELIKTAHKNDIYVILDWVPNHTGWDHVWLKEHPEFYVKNDKGEITDPLNDDGTSKGWGDVAQLDYTNIDMQNEMIKDMLYWVEEEQVDGFRCDHIEPTPVSFWKKAIAQIRAKRAVFMLAENEDPKFMKGTNLFEMEYGWKQHHLMNDIKKGTKALKDFAALNAYNNSTYESDDIIMNFVTNHDENSWAGTVSERLGDASQIMTAFSYMVKGMPLIYSGQEYDLNHRLKFFEKDSIPKEKGIMWPLLEKLGKLKNENKALNGGKNAASLTIIKTNNSKILKLNRGKDGAKITFVGNFSDEEQTETNLLYGKYLDYLTGEKLEFKEDEVVTLQPWEFKIVID